MSDFTPGQRYISDGEADLGLGTILNCDQRTVTVLFAASEQTRTYSVRQAPLTRVVFGRGDRIETDDNDTLIVASVDERAGTLLYTGETPTGEPRELPESRISDRMQFHQARDRLLTAQLDRNDAFNLRYRSLQHLQCLERHPAFGLSGPRVDLIAHQFYIADEITRRRLPRVLLADEVGLGKTIEAGLILHRLLLIGRASRALILVPDSLAHQWLVELLRRFALEVTLLDETQSRELSDDTNPFESGQLVLASQQWLFADSHRQQQARNARWDLLIVDEAQHLQWSPEGGDSGYACVAELAATTAGVLLLTATPEQLGQQSHFAQLHLLDPDRYPDLDAFRREQAGYAGIAEAVEAIAELPASGAYHHIEAIAEDKDTRQLLDRLTAATGDETVQAELRNRLKRALLDRYGIGRVMFRNSRRHVAGFPERRLHVESLDMPAPYRRIQCRLEQDRGDLDELLIETGLDYPDLLLYPELTFEALRTSEGGSEDWWRLDPRIDWLRGWLKAHPGDKALVLCHQADTALELAAGLQILSGLHVPVFHEGMSIIERDRAAAAFADADREDGSPLLICSEIGSEGRNFQFCHHLILFDLPPHPDQLEQRIGRLDRIGQRHPVDIHVPVLAGSPGEALLVWYRDALDAFTRPHGMGSRIFDEYGEALFDALLDRDALAKLVADSRALLERTAAEHETGRDRLLEYGAVDDERASEILTAVRELDEDERLDRWLDQALDVFGIEVRELDDNLRYLHPGPHMHDGMPGLIRGEEGFTVTRSREQALARDDIQRLSWEHPLVQEMLQQATHGALGNTALALLEHPSIPGGRVMIEAIFRTRTTAARAFHPGRFLPPTTVRVLLDESGQELSEKVSFGGLAKSLRNIKKAIARNLIRERHDLLRRLLEQAEQMAGGRLQEIVERADTMMRAQLDEELSRLYTLAQRNPDVRQAEIEALAEERDRLARAIADTRLQLDAVRVIVTVDSRQR